MKKKYVSKLSSETPGLTANVISLDAAMRNALETSSELKALKDKLKQMKKAQSKSAEPDNQAWTQAIQNIKDKIKETSTNSRLRMYLVESAELVDT